MRKRLRRRARRAGVGLADVVVGKGGATGRGAQHRVHHQGQLAVGVLARGRAGAGVVHALRHQAHGGHAAQQAGLDDAGWHVFGQGLQLGLERVWRHRPDGGHTLRMLGGEGRGHGAQVHAQGVGGALVGAQAGTAGGVQAGDAPDDGRS